MSSCELKNQLYTNASAAVQHNKMQVNLLNLTATQAVPNFDLHPDVSKGQAEKF